MSPTDLLTLIRRACEGTAAEGLAPSVVPGAIPLCSSPCPHGTRSWCYASACAPPGLVCIPAVEALARLAVEGAAEVDRLTAELETATAHPRVRVTRSVRPEIVITDDGDWTPDPDDPHVAHTLARWPGMAGQRGGPPAYPETSNPSMSSNGCEPGPVERVELVWLPLPSGGWELLHCTGRWPVGWWLSRSGETRARAEDDEEWLVEWFADGATACLWIADRARALGYRVQAHPLGWDVGVKP